MAKKKVSRQDALLQIRLKPEQLEAYRKAADRDGRTVSNWARDRLDKLSRQELGTRRGE